eukprot:TRINITY_DN2446_c0_g1_i2.p1 TRINITY_DN2446_c0_g1~~TRINITY_DN2446_c0_g1_i2.p1  ORF type:complete len:177 (-),score=25.00 TRINITY_DN2446_c0_g1_i2:354-818(-)
MLLFVRHRLSEREEETLTKDQARNTLIKLLLEYKTNVSGVGWKEEDIVDKWLKKLYKDFDGPISCSHFKSTSPYELNYTAFVQFISNFMEPGKVKQLCEENRIPADNIPESGILEFVHRLICKFESRIGRFVYFPKQSETHYWVQLLGGHYGGS